MLDSRIAVLPTRGLHVADFHRRALAAVVLALAVGAGACARAASGPVAPLPAPADAELAGRRLTRVSSAGEVARAVVPATLVSPGAAEAGAGRAARWVGTYGPGAGRQQAFALWLSDAGAGAYTGALALDVAPRASTFAAGGRRAPAAAVRVPVPLGRYAGGRLALETEPYYDAGCECTVVGTFRAAVRGDTLVGRYETRGAATAGVVRGRWRAVRAR